MILQKSASIELDGSDKLVYVPTYQPPRQVEKRGSAGDVHHPDAPLRGHKQEEDDDAAAAVVQLERGVEDEPAERHAHGRGRNPRIDRPDL